MGLRDLRGSNRIIDILVIPILLALLGPAYADNNQDGHGHTFTDSHKQNVEHMLEMMGMPAQVDGAAREVLKIYSARIKDESVSEDTKKLVAAYQSDLQRMVFGVLSWQAIKPNYINIYASNLTPEDVTAAQQFMLSSSGRKFFNGQSKASGEVQQITKHLIEADLAEPLKQLSKSFREGLVKLQARQNPK